MNTCEECKHFRKHYIKFRGRFSPLNHGHCTKNLRRESVFEKTCACKKFEKLDKKEQVQNQKELVSNFLLNYADKIEKLVSFVEAE